MANKHVLKTKNNINNRKRAKKIIVYSHYRIS